MDDRNDRLRKLKDLLNAANGAVEDTSRLHNLVFLCEYAGTDLGQDFDFQYYRLYSPTLARDLDIAVESELVNQAEESGKVSLRTDKIRKSSQLKEPGFVLVEKLSTEKSDTLEVLSVLCYLYKVGYSEDQLETKLEELKPELKGCFVKAYDLAERHFSIKAKMLAHS